MGVEPDTSITVNFNKAISPGTLSANFELRDGHDLALPARITYDDAARAAVLQPASALHEGTTYAVTLKGGREGILDRHGHPMQADKVWRFTTGITTSASLAKGPGGPLLLVTGKASGFSQYYAEILRNEGLNEFDSEQIELVSASDLARHDVVLVGEIPVNAGQIRMFTDWVRGGGNLIVMRPSPGLAESLGWTLAEPAASGPAQQGGYLRLNAKVPAAAGLFQQPIQFHGEADRYVEGATSIASLYDDEKVATKYPAVSSMQVGAGTAIVFSYDLAKSVIYTRQGNPEWSGVERDGIAPLRSDDLFYGASAKDPEPDWVDPKLIAVPQADIQQRLLANLITLTNAAKKPLPRFWYLPRGLKAAVVLTGDDHGHGGTVGRFTSYQQRSATGCSVQNWECIRATSNIFEGSINPAQASFFAREGFEIDLHVYTACEDWPTKLVRDSAGVERRQLNREAEEALYSEQLRSFTAKYPGLPSPLGSRTDCVTWGDYATQPQVELSHGIRLDTNYYFWPAKWVKNTPGLFTGSGLPMRFAKQDGTLIDVYQAPTQMTDESGQSYPFTVDTLLANALGSSEYFGVFTANMHNDNPKSAGADAIIDSAKKSRVPLITAAQLLKWLDGRNASTFRDLKWSGKQLSFSIAVGIGGNGLEAMLPTHAQPGNLVSLLLNGRPTPWQKRSVGGLSYAAFQAAPGTFCATYGDVAGAQKR